MTMTSNDENSKFSISSVASTLNEGYQIPIESTDYKGLEKLDPRLVDREWRLNNLYLIINKEGKLVKFKLNSVQKEFLRTLHYKNIILKARQLGFTTFICIFMFDYVLFNSNKNAGILAHTQSDATVIFRKVKVAWDNFPKQIKEYLGLNTTEDSKIEYKFTNGSVMRIATSLRSGTYQIILVTEFGKVCARFPEKAQEVITGTLPAVPKAGVIFIESTAEGEDGFYYEMVQAARRLSATRVPLTIKDYKFFFYPWFRDSANQIEGDHIILDEETENYFRSLEQILWRGEQEFPKAYKNWYFLEKKTLRHKMKQENPSTPDEAFLSTGNKLFKADVLNAQREHYVTEPLYIDGNRDNGVDGCFLIYIPFVKGHIYALGADVSLGIKRDSSTMCVIDFTIGEIVMTYRSERIDPTSFAYDIKRGALMYGGCLVAPEANNVGILTCATLNEIYPGMIYTQIRSGLLEDHPTQKLGWQSNGATKPKMMYELSVALEDNLLMCHDANTLVEASRFNKEDSLKIESASALSTQEESETRHFDALTAAAIAWQMRTQASRGGGSDDSEQQTRILQRRANHVNQDTSSSSTTPRRRNNYV